MTKPMRIDYQHRPLRSVPALARHLGVSEDRLLAISESPSQRNYRLVKRLGSAQPRLPEKIVYDTREPLKRIQKRLNARVFRRISYPPYVVGGVPGRNLRDAVAAHMHARSLMTFDIVRFFESTSSDTVERTLLHGLSFSPDVARIVTALTTVNGHLPRGAPTSTYLANLVLFGNEAAFAERLKSYDGYAFRYTRWIDDMTITSARPICSDVVQDVTAGVAGMLAPAGLRFQREKNVPRKNRRKRRVVYDASCVRVHNIEIRGAELSASKALRRMIRSGVHNLERAAEHGALDEEQRHRLESLRSTVGYLLPFHPDEMPDRKARLKQVVRCNARFDRSHGNN